jgi:hypothetical protein
MGRLLVVLALLIPFAAVPAVAAAEDTAPVILSATVTPAGLPYTGGDVTITAHAVDDVGISMAYVEYAGNSNGDFGALQLIPSGPDEYSAVHHIQANFTDNDLGYQYTVRVTDTNGQEAEYYAGEVNLPAQPQFDEPPVIGTIDVAPRSLPADGGPVTIKMQASDLRGISFAFAIITLPDGTEQTVDLIPTSSVDFEGTFDAPPNTGTSLQTYKVTGAAQDDIGQETRADGGTFTVAGRPPTPGGRLLMRPGTRVLGPVALGRSASKTILVWNVGRGPVTGTAKASGPGFTLVAPAAFSIAPGQVKTFVVRYAPTGLGPQRGALTLTRTDGKPGVAVPLLGLGKRK